MAILTGLGQASPPSQANLSEASARLRGVPGFPRAVGRPRKHVASDHEPTSAGPAGQRSAVATNSHKHLPDAMPSSMPPKSRPRPTSGRLLSIPAGAAYLGVSAFTLRGLIRRLAIPLVTLPGVASWYVDREDLDALVVRGKAQP
jgi:hypothetical protein